MALSLTVELAGGAELLFNNKRKHDITLPGREENKAWTLGELLFWMRDNILTV